jgi:hypothetical protein
MMLSATAADHAGSYPAPGSFYGYSRKRVPTLKVETALQVYSVVSRDLTKHAIKRQSDANHTDKYNYGTEGCRFEPCGVYFLADWHRGKANPQAAMPHRHPDSVKPP